MKSINFFLTVLLLFAGSSFTQNITRGPNIGEIYILGLSKSGLDATIYHSTDFGETIECMDSISQNTYWIETIEADKTSGGLYFVTAYGGLHYSNNYGQYGSWDFRQSNISWNICAGIFEGQVYNTFNSHSDDYGVSFSTHQANGFFGGLKYAEIDNLPNFGYVIVNKWGISDSIYFLKTNDNFENLILDTVLNFGYSNNITLSHAVYEGEIFMFNTNNNFSKLWYSNNFADSWIELNTFNFNNYNFYRKGFECGQSNGELYFILHFVSNMWQNVNTYILYSTDYGISFDLFHPLSKGEQPLLCNFSAKVEGEEIIDKNNDSVYYVTGDMPLNVQFFNYSIGEINTYEWDFNNDGIVNSYEQTPIYTYTDTGWYSVNLTVYDDYDTNSFFRENYIYVYESTDVNEYQRNTFGFSCYPNPFTDKIIFKLPNSSILDKNEIVIYDSNGKIVYSLSSLNNQMVWNGTYYSEEKCKPGIYLAKDKKQGIAKKIILIN
jgi:hypothetical protein